MQRRKFMKAGMGFSIASIIPVSTLNEMMKNRATLSLPHKSDPIHPEGIIADSLDDQTVVVRSNGQEVKIHAVQTGKCAVKISHRTEHVSHFLTPVKITLDTRFTEFFPIWTWVIEHPEGVIVIDTGENAGVMQPDYFKPAGKIVAAYNRKNIKFMISEDDEIGKKLKKLNIGNDKIRNVVLTHLHLDHTDGLKDFPNTEILIEKNEFEKPSGNIPQLYPSWFKPRLVSYKNNFIDVFHQAYPITQKEDVLLIPTHGHTPNHASVLFKTDDFDILFAGDVCYSQKQLLENDLPGINADYSQSLKTYHKILEYAKKNRLVFLPSHDADSARRLKDHALLSTLNE